MSSESTQSLCDRGIPIFIFLSCYFILCTCSFSNSHCVVWHVRSNSFIVFVQILLKEFDSRKPQLEKLKEADTSIASASEEKQDPAVEKVKEQLASISQKWQNLTGQLSQRHALIEKAVGKTTQFQELLHSLSECVACLENELRNQQTHSTQPDEVKKQMESTNEILAQLRGEKKRLKEAEIICSELSAMVTEEYLRTDLTKQLETVSKPFKQLEDKAGIEVYLCFPATSHNKNCVLIISVWDENEATHIEVHKNWKAFYLSYRSPVPTFGNIIK